MAEREGFEPPIPVKVWPLSRRLVSTTHAPLRARLPLAEVASLNILAGANWLRFTAPGAAFAKERLQQIHATRGQNARRDFELMIQLRMVEHLQHRVNCSSLGVFCSVDQAADARVRDGAGAHRAGFDRDIQIAVQQAIIADRLRSFTKRQYFGMGRGIVGADRPIASPAYDLAIVDNNRANRNFAHRQRTLRLAKSFFHP